MAESTTTRRDVMGWLALGGATLSLSRAVHAGGGDEPCPELLGRPLRVIGPDTAVTMDYNAERVNVHHDDKGLITRITFG